MKNKFFIIVLLFFSSLMLPSCTSSTNTVVYAPGPPLRICATISPVYIITADLVNTRRNIALEQIIPTDADAKTFTIAEDKLAYFAGFDICVINGFGIDNHVADRLSKINPKIKIVDSSKGIEPFMIDSDSGEIPNPYIWNSPVCNAVQYRNIAAEIVKLDLIGTDKETAPAEQAASVKPEKEPADPKKAAPAQKPSALREIHNRALLTDQNVFEAYNNAIKASGLKPVVNECPNKKYLLAANADGSLDIIHFAKMMNAGNMPVSLDITNVRSSGELRPIAAEGYLFDYLARDFGLCITSRISSSDRDASLSALAADSKNAGLVVFIVSSSKEDNISLCKKYPALRFCFLERLRGREMLPDSLQKVMLYNFNSIVQAFAAGK